MTHYCSEHMIVCIATEMSLRAKQSNPLRLPRLRALPSSRKAGLRAGRRNAFMHEAFRLRQARRPAKAGLLAMTNFGLSM